jgi:predicted ATPase
MFEAGARAHPPRDLYRAYLAQSDIFVAIYWNRYGWIAPDMQISGLEDEYRLSGEMPRLVYVKRSEAREPRLLELIDRLTGEDSLSYRPFSTADELGTLIADDLAHLLTEGFARSRAAPPADTRRDERRAPPPLAFVPEPAGPLHGRDGLLAECGDLLRREDVRLVTLTGPGGVGKTSLAVHLARRAAGAFADGAAYVSLAAVRDPSGVLPAVIGTLELPPPGAGVDALRQLVGHLRGRRVLLVLDNFEQVIDAAPALSSLLASCRGLTLLVTSRTPLRLTGEHEVRVPPLAHAIGAEPSAAARLFEERARAVRPGFVLDAVTTPLVETLCHRLDGLPLAIELAAARTRVLTVQAMLPRLDKVLPVLVGGARDLPARQQTLRGTFEWSYSLLSSEERTLFRRLGALTGSFPLELATAIGGAELEPQVIDLLESLLEKSLVVPVELGGEARYALLETAREFAHEKLLAEDDVRAARARLAEWAVVTLDELSVIAFHHQMDGDRFHREFGHLAAALGFAVGPEGNAGLASRLFPVFGLMLLGLARVREAQAWLARTRAAGPAPAGLEAARVDAVAGGILQAVNQNADAVPLLESAVAQLGLDPFGMWSKLNLAQSYAACGEPDRGRDVLRSAVDDASRSGLRTLESAARMVWTMFVLMGGDVPAAHAEAERLVAFCEQSGERSVVSPVVAMAGLTALLTGDAQKARARLANAVALARETHNPWGGGMAYPLLAAISVSEGDLAEAGAVAEEGLARLRAAGLGSGTVELLAGLRGALAVRQGDEHLGASLLQLLPDGFEDDPKLVDLGLFDPLGVLRGEIRIARATLGTRGKQAPDREALFDDVLDRLLRGRSA